MYAYTNGNDRKKTSIYIAYITVYRRRIHITQISARDGFAPWGELDAERSSEDYVIDLYKQMTVFTITDGFIFQH